MQSGATLSAEEQDRLANIMKRAAEQQLKNAGTSLAGATEMHGATAAVASALGINADANKKTAEQQRAAALESSGFNKKIQESQQRLAEFSNGFQIALANSGMIDFLMDAFSTMATLVQTFVVPAFEIIAKVLPAVGAGLAVYLGLLLASNAQTIIELALKKVGIVLQALSNAPLLLFSVAIGGLIMYFRKLGGDMQVFKDSFKVLGSYFTEFGQGIKLIYYKIMDKITAGDKYKKLAEEQEQRIADTQKEREELKKGISDRMKANRAANAHDSKNLDEKKRLDAEKNKLDYDSGPEALLKQFGIKENSKFHIDAKKDEFNKEKLAAEEKLAAAKTTAEKKAAIGKIEDAEKKLADLDKLSKGEAVPKEKSRESLPKAESAKKELEQKGEEKTAAEKKAADERAKAEEKSKEENKKGKGAAPTQESAETLLAQLNTKMTELIKINKGTQAVSEQQLSVQKGMTSDLFAA
jgi:membrane protein involved in colicin uptake